MILFIVTLTVGASGIIAQVLLLRQLLVNVCGNELVVGVMLANWLLAEAAGAYSAGRFAARGRTCLLSFAATQLVFSLMVPSCVYAAEVFKALVGIPPAEAAGVWQVIGGSLAVLLPVSFLHGAQFVFLTRLQGSVARVYAWETVGTIIGGMLVTYYCIPHLTPYQASFAVSAAGMAAAALLVTRKAPRAISAACYAAALLLLLLPVTPLPRLIQERALATRWKGVTVLEQRDSLYGSIAVTKREEQYTFFYNGTPVVSVPTPDPVFAEEFGTLTLLFHDDPKRIAVIGGGAGGVIGQILSHKPQRVDYAELDPLLIELIKKYAVSLTARELSDPCVAVHTVDGRYFLRSGAHPAFQSAGVLRRGAHPALRTAGVLRSGAHRAIQSARVLRSDTALFDMVLVGITDVSGLVTNRVLTKEFFALARARLAPNGMVALHLPGSPTFMSRQRAELNACILAALKSVFTHVRVIPGDTTIVLGSAESPLEEVTASLIARRIQERGIETSLLYPSYLKYRLDPRWVEWYNVALKGRGVVANSDIRPAAVFQAMVLWVKQTSAQTARFLEGFEKLRASWLLWGIAAMTALVFFRSRQGRGQRFPSALYAIGTTGAGGMMAYLCIIFSFQTSYGYLYQQIGMLISLFMAGAAAGSLSAGIAVAKSPRPFSRAFRLLAACEWVFCLFVAFLATIASGLIAEYGTPVYAFMGLLAAAGFFVGAEFPLAHAVLVSGRDPGRAVGSLYAADLFGSWIAGMLTGVVLLPVIGIGATCGVAAALKLGSALAVTWQARFFSLQSRKSGI